MSITNITVITDALRDLGVIAETETPTADQGAHALRQLNQMLEEWEESQIRLEYFAQTSTSDTCPIPGYAEGGVTAQLAVRLAPTYGAEVSQALAAKAVSGKAVITRIAMNSNLPRVLPDRPQGEGQRYRQNILTGD